MTLELFSIGLSALFSARYVLLIFIPVAYLYWYKRPGPKFPPGPRGIPILGVAPYLSKYPAKDFKRWSLEKYGPVMSVRLGSDETVVLNTYEAINQVFVKEGAVSSDRPFVRVFAEVTGQNGVIVAKYNDVFKSQKHFALKFLRDAGLGSQKMERLINDEGDRFLGFISKMDGPVDFKKHLYTLTANVISRAMFAKQYDYDDADFLKCIDTINALFSHPDDSPKMGLMTILGILTYIPPFSGAFHRFNARLRSILDFVQKDIDEHKKNFDPENINDFIDAFLAEQKFGKHAKQQGFTDEQLPSVCTDMLAAGAETSSTSLCWLYVYFLNFPEHGKKVENEICEVLGASGIPSLANRVDMPLTCAFIQEVMRIKTISPLAIPHFSTGIIKVNGLVIPKGTKLMANLWGAHMDPETWPNPEQFDPMRHIDENGKFVASNKIIPFSVGPRFCLGESLARAEIFIFFVKILQRFHVRCGSNQLPPIDKTVLYLISCPTECKVKLELRE